jgi:hypothetical protein
MPLPLVALGALKFFRGLPLSVYLAVAVAGGFWIQHWRHGREVGGLRKQIVGLEQTLTHERLVHANTLVALEAEKANVTKMQATIDARNHTIEAQALEMKAAEVQAGLAATNAFRKGLASAEALRAPTTTVKPGAVEMNAWWQERFAR